MCPVQRAIQFVAVLLLVVCSAPANASNFNLSVPATDADGNYTVTWNNFADANIDEIQRLQEKLGSGSWSTVYTGYSGSVNRSGRANGTWSYRVEHEACFGFFCDYTYSSVESVVVGSTPIPGVPGPITAPDIVGAPEGGASYTISWGGSTGTVTRYEIGVTSNGTSTSKLYSSVSPGSYTYQIRACNNTGCSAYNTAHTVEVRANGIASAPSVLPAGDIGSTPYAVDVATNGDSRISVPVQVVDGINGFQPVLSIEYDSGRGVDRERLRLPEDTIGYGWFVAGLSQIRRCVVDQPNGNNVNFGFSDSLCLDDMPLELVSGNHLYVGATYRTRVESYIEVELKAASGNAYFEARFPDGSVNLYGFTADSTVNHNVTANYQYSLTKSTDPYGNEISYSYFKPDGKGTNYPVRIDYADAAVEFKYESRTDAAGMSMWNAVQTRSVRLHTIAVSYDGKAVREYRLIDEYVGGNNRLRDIQMCGFTSLGLQRSCLDALHVDWIAPSQTMPGVEVLVQDITDSLGAEHRFEYGTITGSSHSFFFSERPWGNASYPSNTQALSGSGARRHVVTKMRRDNGLASGIFSDTLYKYHGPGVQSTRNWGFLGFFAQRIEDDPSNRVSYVQNRVDFPHFGQPARVYTYTGFFGGSVDQLSAVDIDYTSNSHTHSSGNVTVLPLVGSTIESMHEGSTTLGATKTVTTRTFSGELVTSALETTTIGTGLSRGSVPSLWGDIESVTVSNLQHTSESSISYQNRTSGSDWLIGFVSSASNESWKGAKSGNGVVRDATFTPEPNSLDIASTTRFPTHATLTLTSSFGRDALGRVDQLSTSGDNVAPRSTDITAFALDRYASVTENPYGHTTTHGVFDHRFGTPGTQGAPDNSNTVWSRDQFGRLTQITKDGTPGAQFEYLECNSSLCPASYGVLPVYMAKRHMLNWASDNLIVPENVYFDRLGRVVRREALSLGGSWSRVDVAYDNQGRVKEVSQPYFPGSTKYSTLHAYDIKDRLSTATRPDGSSTMVTYAVSGNDVIQEIDEVILTSAGAAYATQTKRNRYNILGQLEQTWDAYGSADVVTTSFQYDAHGNLDRSEVNAGGTSTVVTTFDYDEAGNRKQVVSPNSGTNNATYTALNQVRTTSNAVGTGSFTYDLLGRTLTHYTSIDGTKTWTWDLSANGKGKLHKLESSGFVETYFYNSDGKLDSVDTQITPIGGGTATTYSTSQTYDSYGRPLKSTYPDTGLEITREYNANGYMHRLKNGSTVLKTIVQTDSYGNIIDEILGNAGNNTYIDRIFDSKTGRLTDVDTIRQGGTKLIDSEYDWRSDGVLERRGLNVVSGLNGYRQETFSYDALNRILEAEMYEWSSNTRDLDYDYDVFGNLTLKTSTRPGDVDVTNQAYGAGSAGPNALTSATVSGVNYTLTYNGVGAVTRYDIASTSNDRYLAYNAANQPTKITVGNSLNDTTPEARDEFAYAPDGRRYYRKTTWKEGGSTYTENVAIVGGVEIVTDNVPDGIDKIVRTQVTPDIMHVKTVSGSSSQSAFEFAHRDHLGTIELVTNFNGFELNRMAAEPFGQRKSKDWRTNIPAAELDALLDRGTLDAPRVRGFTGHEHLDRTGFVHMNGRVYDPVLGRFLSPDPVVPFPAMSQSWNSYSYVQNQPMGRIDPTGFTDIQTEVIGAPGMHGHGWGLFYIHDGSNMHYIAGDSPASSSSSGGVQIGTGSNRYSQRLASTSEEASFGLVRPFARGSGRIVSYAIFGATSIWLVTNNSLDSLRLPTNFAEWELVGPRSAHMWGDGADLGTAAEWEAGGRGTPTPGMDPDEDPYEPADPTSWKQFGHAFTRHGQGAKNTMRLTDRARAKGPQGQWLNNQAAANYIRSLQLEGTATIRIPQGMGQVILPNGRIVSTNLAEVHFVRGSIRTAFPKIGP